MMRKFTRILLILIMGFSMTSVYAQTLFEVSLANQSEVESFVSSLPTNFASSGTMEAASWGGTWGAKLSGVSSLTYTATDLAAGNYLIEGTFMVQNKTVLPFHYGVWAVGDDAPTAAIQDEGTNSTFVAFSKTVSVASDGDYIFGILRGNHGSQLFVKEWSVTKAAATVLVTGVELDSDAGTLGVGASHTLTATVSPEDASNKEVTWSTSDEGIATVVDGVVTAVAIGTATITVTTTDGSFTDTFVATIEAPKAVTGVTLDDDAETIIIGDDYTLTASVQPVDAANKAVTWASGDEAIATVVDGVVTGEAVGSTTITVTTEDGDFEATFDVTVESAAVTGLTVTPSTGNAFVGTTTQLTATVAPANATNKSVTWSSDDTDIATVSASGLVTGVAEGTAIVTATSVDGSFTGTSTITVGAAPAVGVTFDNITNYAGASFRTNGTMAVTVNYNLGGETMNGNGVQVVLRHLTSAWGLVTDYAAPLDQTGIGTSTGSSTVSIDLTDVVLSNELPSGDFYWLWVRVHSTGGLKEVSTFQNNGPVIVPEFDSSEKEILGFSLGLVQSGEVVIDKTNFTITAETTFGTDNTALSPVITVSDYATISPESGTPVDFTNPVSYTVTAQDMSTQVWMATITAATSEVDVTGVAVTPAPASVKTDATVQLTAVVSPSNATNKAVTWTSSDDDIATVDQTGLVTGVSSGEVTITATSDEDNTLKGTSTVTVTAAPKAVFDDLSKYTQGTFQSGGTMEVVVDYNAGEGQTIAAEGIKYMLRHLDGSWAVTGEDFEIIDESVVGTSSGTSTVTLNLTDATLTSELPTGDFWWLWVQVFTTDGTLEVSAANIKIVSQGASEETDITAFALAAQDEAATIDTDNHTVSIAVLHGTDVTALTPTITLSQGATVSPNSGTAQDFTSAVTYTVTAASGAIQDWVVTVTEAPLVNVTGISLDDDAASIEVGKTHALVATVLPANASNKKVTWSTSDASIATVVDGVLTAIGEGVATITATSEDGNFTADFTVTVHKVTAIVGEVNLMSVYPNPVSSILKIDNPIGYHTVSIINLIGVEVLRKSLTTSESIDVSSFDNGVYLLKFTSEKGTESARIVVSH
ncbi:Ig-like domain-containing protein [Reichenbachiella carrageenanivorans]|uniref:Ig-like domain-containing protein n=1 Tax=Reichenbachiella carrageenanivorans TaxID=2979869 RepID=A0ABY6CYZ1_9BACT|nr:Ig-like domain-containing protein [Reichenbachiella carrageenanivorans]UXX79141.1 Ig-like domain-containing protein [Reichenbachiella carrageenanivorans]